MPKIKFSSRTLAFFCQLEASLRKTHAFPQPMIPTAPVMDTFEHRYRVSSLPNTASTRRLRNCEKELPAEGPIANRPKGLEIYPEVIATLHTLYGCQGCASAQVKRSKPVSGETTPRPLLPDSICFNYLTLGYISGR